MISFLNRLPILVRYLLAGGTSTTIDLGLLYVLTEYAGWWYLASATAAFSVAVFVSFTLQKFYTFRHRDASGRVVATQSTLFLALQFTNIGINAVFMYALVEWVGLHYFLAQIIAAAAIAVGSFFVYRFFIFRPAVSSTAYTGGTMDRRSYKDIFTLEETHWWFCGRRAIVRSLLQRWMHHGTVARAIDIGCGTGTNTALLAPYAQEIEGIDLSPDALALARQRYPHRVFTKTDVSMWGTQSGPLYDLVTMFDVLEHLVDDRAALALIQRRMRRGGTLILTVPAFPFLWSPHDERLGHFRRYTAATLRKVLRNTGFRVCKMSYFNCFLFPIVVAVRLWNSAIRHTDVSDFSRGASWVNGILTHLFSAERFVLAWWSLPFGVSLVCVATKE